MNDQIAAARLELHGECQPSGTRAHHQHIEDILSGHGFTLVPRPLLVRR